MDPFSFSKAHPSLIHFSHKEKATVPLSPPHGRRRRRPIPATPAVPRRPDLLPDLAPALSAISTAWILSSPSPTLGWAN